MGVYTQLLLDGVLLGGLYILVATGITLSYGVIRIINFAHGEFIMLGSYAAFWAVTIYGLDPLLMLPVIVVGGGLFGYAVQRLLIDRILAAPHINQILLTFGISLILQNLAAILWTGDLRSAQSVISYSVAEVGPVVVPYARLLAFVVALALVLGMLVWLKWSEVGRASRAVAHNHRAAMLMGINIYVIYGICFAVSASLGAAAGGLMSFLVTISPWMGFPLVVKSFAVVVLGGLGSVLGTIVGGFVLGISETLISYFVPGGSGWAEGVSFVLLIGVLVLRPRGIFGQAVEEQIR
jgi:branched-chain amino acid transport system permease protein